jgi:GNAT superfamily N-acetyltransferase
LLANTNTAALWNELAAARGQVVVRNRTYLCVPGSARDGLQIIMLHGDPDPAEAAEVTELVRSWPADSPITVEDPYHALDLTGTGLTPAPKPVMLREPGPLTGTPQLPAQRVSGQAETARTERVMVEGFPLRSYLPYLQGEAFPAHLAQRPGLAFHLALRDGLPAGGCLTVNADGVGGLYWVATLPEHRSHGVGRAVLTSALTHLADVPATLIATPAGKPLYESMGFHVIAESTWWRRAVA